MNGTLNRIILSFFIIILVFTVSCDRSLPVKHEIRHEGVTAYFGNGFLKYDHGIPVLVLQGSPAEMGLQYGVLLKEELKKSLSAMDELMKGVLEERPWYQRVFFPLWKRWYIHSMGKRIPDRYLEELNGIAEGSGIDYDTVLFIALGAGVIENSGCTAALVRTKRGMIHGRNFDWMPLFLGGTPLVIEYRPGDRQRYTSFTMIGVPGLVQGINEKGITLTTNIAFRLRRETGENDGMPVMFKNREVMENAVNLESASRMYHSWHTDESGWMITMASAAENDGRIIEMYDNNVVGTSLADGCAYIHNILFDPARLGNSELSRRYTEIHMGQGEYNLSRHMKSEKMLKNVKDVDSMLDYLACAGVFGLDDILMSDNAGVNNPYTINTMVFDPSRGHVYYASAPGLSAFSAVYRYDLASRTFIPYRAENSLMKTTGNQRRIFARMMDLYFMRKNGELVRSFDISEDNAPVMLRMAVKSWLAVQSSRDVNELLSSVNLHIKRHPEYGLYHLLKGQLLAASGRNAEAEVELKEAADSTLISTEDRLNSLIALCDLTDGAERKEWMERYVKLVDELSATWHIEESFYSVFREMKAELKRKG